MSVGKLNVFVQTSLQLRMIIKNVIVVANETQAIIFWELLRKRLLFLK